MLEQVQFNVRLFVDDSDVNRSRKALLMMMHALMGVNLTWLQSQPTPTFYSSGVIYKPEVGTEIWRDIPTILAAGFGDCEDLACWRAAELNYVGIAAKPYLKWRESGPLKRQFHAVLQWPDGRIEDPSAARGMNGLPLRKEPVFVTPGPMPS